MITEKAWHFVTRDWVADCILNYIDQAPSPPVSERTLYRVVITGWPEGKRSKPYPSWITIGSKIRNNIIRETLSALRRRGQLIIVCHAKTQSVFDEPLYDLGTLLDRLAAAHPALPPLGSARE